MTKARDAEIAYRRAFDEFADRVAQVQSLTANPNADRNAIDIALLELERARYKYNHRRDEWAEHLLHSSRDSYEQTHDADDRLCTAGRR